MRKERGSRQVPPPFAPLAPPVNDRIGTEVAGLTGCTVTVAFLNGEIPTLILRSPQGREVQVEAWCDPEGNGPGFLSIGPVVS